MSSEALERALTVLRTARKPVVVLVDEADALLAEVARLEQEPAELRRAWRANVEELTRQYGAALAVAREREQLATEGLGRAYRDSETGERCVIARLCDVYLDRSGALLGRVRAAALVDEPAAATLAEPGGESVRSTTGSNTSRQEPFQRAPAPSGSASAAADEPGETPA